jgi:hypothetical protein
MDDSEITLSEAAFEAATDQCDVTQLDGNEVAALLERIPGARERIEQQGRSKIAVARQAS